MDNNLDSTKAEATDSTIEKAGSSSKVLEEFKTLPTFRALSLFREKYSWDKSLTTFGPSTAFEDFV